jgi:RimJ/RimL family protein N-acetyltransferase
VIASGRRDPADDDTVLVEELVLRDGTPAMIWPLLPSDRAMLSEGFAALSAKSRYQRFLSPLPSLTEPALRRLVDDVDGIDHVAVLLVVLPPDGDDRPVGVARLVRYADNPAAADIAVTVSDEWQGRGAGTALVEAVLARRPAGVTQLRSFVQTGNVASLSMLARAGKVHSQQEAGVLEVYVDLSHQANQHVDDNDALGQCFAQ